MMVSRGIWIINEEAPSEDGGKGAPTWDGSKGSAHRSRISAQTLKDNMEEFISVLEEALEQAEKSQNRIRLEEIELAIEVNGEGQVSLLGTGGKAGGKGAITLKFKRASGA